MTDIDVYQPPAGIGQYQAGIVMTPESAKALDDQVRRCTEAVLREGTDYGVIPGTNGEKTLWRPGAQKLLQWFGLSCTCERVEIERDDEGRKHGITYRATVTRRLPDGTPWILATCEGTADYDESKFYQSAEQVQRKAEDRERAWAAKDGRPARPTKWQGLPEYRADWNALMKRAQKRAIVGAVVDATAAGGIFSDREEDDHAPVPQDDAPSWYEQALEAALGFTDRKAGEQLYVQAAQAYRDGLCSGRQKDHIQNRVRQRLQRINTGRPVDVEDLARPTRNAPPAAEDDTRTQPRGGRRHAAQQADTRGPGRPAAAATPPLRENEVPTSGAAATSATDPANGGNSSATSTDLEPDDAGTPENQPGTADDEQLQQLHTILSGLGSGRRDERLAIAEAITGRELTGPAEGRTSKNLSWTEAADLIRVLSGFVTETGERDRDALIAWMATRGNGEAA